VNTKLELERSGFDVSGVEAVVQQVLNRLFDSSLSLRDGADPSEQTAYLKELAEANELPGMDVLWAQLLDPWIEEDEWAHHALIATEAFAMVGVSTRKLLDVWKEYARLLHETCQHEGLDSSAEWVIVSVVQRHFSQLVAQVLDREADVRRELRALTEEIRRPGFSVAATSDLMGSVLARISGISGLIGGFFGRFDSDGRLQFEHFDGEVFGPFNAQVAQRRVPSIALDPNLPEGQGPAGRAWRSGEIETTPSLLHDPTMAPWAEVYNAIGIRSAILVPVVNLQGQSIALIGMYSRWPGYFEVETRFEAVESFRQVISGVMNRRRDGHVVPHQTQLRYRELLHSGHLAVRYQPIVHLGTGEVRKVEALARLQEDDGSLISPFEFLSTLGADDLLRVFEGVLTQSADALRVWRSSGLDLHISVNLPPQGLVGKEYLEVLSRLVALGVVDPTFLTLEVTEEEQLSTTSISPEILEGFAALGIRLSQDDLGSGYSSLQRFNSIGFDEVKIDQMLVRNSADPLGSLKMVQNLTQLAHDLDIAIVVEGLESPDLLEAASIIGADLGQGYTIARPMAQSEVTRFARSFEWEGSRIRPRTGLGGVAALWRWARQVDAVEEFSDPLIDRRLTEDLRDLLVYLVDEEVDRHLDALAEAVALRDRRERARVIDDLSQLFIGRRGSTEATRGPSPSRRGTHSALSYHGMSLGELRRALDFQRQLLDIASSESSPVETAQRLCELLATVLGATVLLAEAGDGTPPVDPLSETGRQTGWMAHRSVLSAWYGGLQTRLRTRTTLASTSLRDPQLLERAGLSSGALGETAAVWSIPAYRKTGTAIYLLCLVASDRWPTPAEELLLEDMVPLVRTQIDRSLQLGAAEVKTKGLQDVSNEVDRIRFRVDASTGAISEPSEGAVRFYGFSREELMTKTIFDVSATMTPELLADLIRRYPDDVPFRLGTRHRDGSGTWREIELFSVLRTQGDQRYFDTIYVETDGLSESERMLLVDRAMMERIINTSAVVIFAIDALDRVMFVNKLVCTMTGRDERELRGGVFDWGALIADRSLDAAKDAMGKAARSGLPQPVELWLNDQRREERLYSFQVGPLHDESGAYVGSFWSGVDLTERHLASEDARDQRVFVERILESISNVVIVLDTQGRIVRTNTSFEDITGRAPEAFFLKPNLFLSLFTPRFRPLVLDWYDQAVAGSLRERTLAGVTDRQGAERLYEWQNALIADEEGGVSYIVCVGSDVTDNERRSRELRRAAAVFENSIEGIVIADEHAKITDVNEGFCRISGYSRDECIGREAGFWGSDRHDQEFFSDMYASLEREDHWSGTIWNRRKDGTVVPILMHVTPIKDLTGANDQYVAICTDISDMMHHQRQLSELAFHDILTGLPNRSLLAERLKSAMAESRRNRTILAIAYLDLDDFKPVNDRYGHAEGDQLLVELARRLSHELREVDTVARIGGDEFVCVLPAFTSAEECSQVLDRVVATIEVPFMLNEGSLASRCRRPLAWRSSAMRRTPTPFYAALTS
jgi:diguanylate cyclase (GGDEF)-like protein/PAS domain S-box-containing protein